MDLFDATLDGYDLEIETIDDQFEKVIVRHDIPKLNGAILEDMGLKARVIHIRCHFWDDGAHQTYADHIDFLNHLKSQELFELIHPKYGPLQGSVEQVSIKADDQEQNAEIDLTFVESLASNLADIEYELTDVEAPVEEAYADTLDDLEESVTDNILGQLGLAGEAFLEQALDPLAPLIDQYHGLNAAARSYLRQVDAVVATIEATLAEITNSTNSLTATISFATNLPGRVVGALARCLERYAISYASLSSAPPRFVRSFQAAALDLENRVEVSRQAVAGSVGAASATAAITAGNPVFAAVPVVRVAAAAQMALSAGAMFKADEEVRQMLRRSEQTPSFAATGRYLKQAADQQIMTAIDLETTLATSREMIQGAIAATASGGNGTAEDSGRQSQNTLKTMARLLLEYANTVKLEREKIVAITLAHPLPLHLVCLMRGLPYNYAERIHSINRIPKPNMASGRVNVYAR